MNTYHYSKKERYISPKQSPDKSPTAHAARSIPVPRDKRMNLNPTRRGSVARLFIRGHTPMGLVSMRPQNPKPEKPEAKALQTLDPKTLKPHIHSAPKPCKPNSPQVVETL